LRAAAGAAGRRSRPRHQANHDRRDLRADLVGPRLRGLRHRLAHLSDRGVQYESIRYSTPIAEAGVEPSVGSVGASYDNALAETIEGLFKTEVIWPNGPWRTIEEVEYATHAWVDWFNNRRLLRSVGDVPPAELEAMYHEAQASPVKEARFN
jgi:transposase InsO family protein